jgi:biotin-dependent carboxylase-like uncharacterized protein
VTFLRVDDAGPATSVQDIGRFGAQRFGLGTSGALDRFSLAIANTLAGRAPADAAVEVGPSPARFTAIDGPVALALAGAERDIAARGRRLSLDRIILLESGDVLTLGGSRSGVFTYLSLAGGIRGDPVFGSLSVHARAGLGSPFPRPLQAGDLLELANVGTAPPMRRLSLAPVSTGPIRVVLGPQNDYFPAETISLFLEVEWRVSSISDRMAYRLEGPRLAHAKGHNIVSDGVANGHVQVPGSGEPIVLLADRGTTGGYPKIACIATVDLGRFAQHAAGSAVRFQAISVEAAQAEARRFADTISKLQNEVGTDRADFSSQTLLSANLAGNAVDAADDGGVT